MITLGSSIDDGLYVQSSFLEESALSIDCRQKRILVKQKDMYFALNHNVITGPSVSFRTCDILECFNVRIVFHDAFIMVNRCANIYPAVRKAQPLKQRADRLACLQKEPLWHTFILQDPVIRVKLQEPERINEPQEYSVLLTAAPAVLMSAASFMSGLIHAYSGWMNGRSWIEILPLVLMPAMMVLSSLFLMPYARFLQKRSVLKQIEARDSRYEEYLEQTKKDIQAQIVKLQDSLTKTFFTADCEDPFTENAPHRLMPQKALFCAGMSEDLLRIEAAMPASAGSGRLKEITGRFADFCRQRYKIPYIADLDAEKDISVLCTMRQALYIISQLAVYCDPAGTAMVLLIRKEDLEEHWFLSGMPHLMHDIRYIACTEEQLVRIGRSLRTERRKVIVLHLRDDLALEDGSYLHLRFFQADIRSKLLLDLQEGACARSICSQQKTSLQVPECRISFEKLFASLPSAVQPAPAHGGTFFDMLGIHSENELRIRERWEKNRCGEGIRAYPGTAEDGSPVMIDLSQNGHGPHGLIAGTTGSGKSELLLSMLLSLAVNYSPRELQIVLIDFKGGGAAQALTAEYPLPHLAGVLTDLDIDEMKRALVSFRSECRRREELFRALHEKTSLPVMDINDYRRINAKEKGAEPLAELLIVVDEFAELKQQRPEFMQELITCARIGRSLGIHLILTTQKIGSIVSEEIQSNSRFRICLKVSQKQDSAEIIGSPDALYLKEAGEFIFRCEDRVRKGRAAYANARRAPDPCNVMVIDETCSPVKSWADGMPAGIPQISRILAEILKEGREMTARPLWCDPVRTADRDLMSQTETLCIGLADDIRNTVQYPFCTGSTRLNMILSSSLQEKKRFIHALLYALLKESQGNEEVFLIDDLYAADRKLCSLSYRITDIFDSACKEKTDNLFRHIREDSSSVKYLVITDAARFLEADEGNRQALHDLISHAESYSLHLFVITSACGSLSFSDQTLLSGKIALFHHSMQEIQILLGTGGTVRIKEGFGAFLKDGPVLFRMKDINDEVLAEAAEADGKKNTGVKYAIPCMPDHIYTDECDGDLFGIAVKDYRKIIRRNGEVFVLTALYADELDAFAAQYGNACRARNEEEITDFLKRGDGILAVLLRDLEHSRSLHALKQDPILFVGPGYPDQYLFTGRVRSLQENEGVLIYRSKSEVVRLAEKR